MEDIDIDDIVVSDDYCARCGAPFTDGDADEDYCQVCRKGDRDED